MGKAGQGSRSGRREHLAEDKFLKELEKMYAQGRVEGNGNVTVSISRMADKHIKAPKPTGAKKGKKEEPAPSGAVTKGSHAIVRGKRKGVSISCLVASDDILKFHANMASSLRGNIDNLKRPEKKPKAKKAPQAPSSPVAASPEPKKE